jgi:hypothetical protein
MHRRSFAAMGLVAFATLGLTSTASAECLNYPIAAGDHLNVGYAFVATVTEVSDAVDPPQADSAPYDWHVELDVERTYRGHVPDRLTFNGWDVGCHNLRGDHLRAGDRIFIATERLDLRPSRVDPFWGDVVAWKGTRGAWAFYATALDHAYDKAFYPAAARSATTTADILALIHSDPAPDTSTEASAAEPSKPTPLLALGLALVVGLFLGWRRLSRNDVTRGQGDRIA